MKRFKANDPTALRQMGGRRYREGDSCCPILFDSANLHMHEGDEVDDAKEAQLLTVQESSPQNESKQQLTK